MKRSAFKAILLIISLLIISCAPVLRKDVMDKGARNVPLSEIMRNPEANRGKLFIFGGYIISTRVTAEGSLIEALYVPVNARGSLKDSVDGRFLALFTRESGILDPMIFHKGREITLAAEFVGTREGKLDETSHVYPLFRIYEYYLWEVQRPYYYYPPYYYDPFYYDFFFFDRPFLRRHHHFERERLERERLERERSERERGGPEHRGPAPRR